MGHPSLIDWLEGHIQNSNAYRVVDQYVLFVEGVQFRVEIHDSGVEGCYRYTVRVTNVATGKVSDLGNGGPTPEEALDVFHWDFVQQPR